MTTEVEARAGGSGVALGSRWAVLANRDFRLLWLFHVSNFLAISVEMLAGGWLVLELTNSPFWLRAAAGIFLVSPLALIFIRPRFQRAPIEEAPLRAIAGGLSYAFRDRPVATLLLVSAVGEFFGFSYNTLLPVLARDVLEVGATG